MTVAGIDRALMLKRKSFLRCFGIVMRIFLSVFIILCFLVVAGALPVEAAGIALTKHNLSRRGPGPVKSATEERVCVFCHTPHITVTGVEGGDVPLWNRTMSKAQYQPYKSPSLLSPVVQPDGSSKACLSCHDGTVALASLANAGTVQNPSSMQGAGAKGEIPSGAAFFGTNLSGHHPISIEMSQTLIQDKSNRANDSAVSFKICDPPAGSPVKLAKTKNTYGGVARGLGVQCTSCHDAHNDPDPGNTVFLRVGNKDDFDQLCTACHRDASDECR